MGFCRLKGKEMNKAIDVNALMDKLQTILNLPDNLTSLNIVVKLGEPPIIEYTKIIDEKDLKK